MRSFDELENFDKNILQGFISEEGKIMDSERVFLRPGNPDYHNKKLQNHKFYILSRLMEFSNILNLSIHTKRVNILRLLRHYQKCSDPNKSDILMSCLIQRTLFERISYFYYLVRQIRNYPLSSDLLRIPENLEEELIPRVVRSIFSTSIELRETEDNFDFAKDEFKKYSKKERDQVDRNPINILTLISQLDKKVSGVRNAYFFLSEFVHPNIGDLDSATTKFDLIKNEFGDPVIRRQVSSGGFNVKPNFGKHLNQTTSIFFDAIEFYIPLIEEIDDYLKLSTLICQRTVHGFIKENGIKKLGFRQGTKCPCMSGLRIKDCL